MMLSILLASLAFLSGAAASEVTGKLGNAAITNNNLPSVSWQAILPDSDTSGIRGQITGTSNDNGTGVDFNINFYGFPNETENGPFTYHIHAFPVPADGNCTGTLAHLDPYIRGETPACDATQPETCEVGDLAGKHGNITTNPFQTTYLELYTTTTEGTGAFFGNRSIVIHNQNLTRLTCANFTLAFAGYENTSTTASLGALPSEKTNGAAAAMATKSSKTGAMVAGFGIVMALFML